MLLKFLALIFVFVMLFPFVRQPPEPFDKLIKEVHVYSGLSPDHFYMFLKEMDQFKKTSRIDPHTAAGALYRAIEHVRELALYSERSDSDHAIELNNIANRLGYGAEDILSSSCRVMGLRFTPKYLNEMIPETPDDSDAFGPNHKETGPICARGSCRG